MKLDIKIENDPKIPYEKRDENISKRYANGISVTAQVQGFKRDTYIREEYKGKFTTRDSVDSITSHLIWYIYGTGTNLLKDTELKDGNCISYRHEPAKYDIDKEGMKRLIVEFKSVEDIYNFKRTLERLEKKWFVAPREESVNDCDYWHGFYGTSANLWKGSNYSRGNPGERAIQLAFELEHGIRKSEGWSIWYFPGSIFTINKKYKPEQLKVINKINETFEENHNLNKGIGKVVNDLNRLGKRYLALNK